MTDAFTACLMHTLLEEGGERQTPGQPLVRGRYAYSNHPRDPGKATMLGVTQDVYDAWRRTHGLPTRDVRQIEDAELGYIYHENYWTMVRGDELPSGIDLLLFDFAVNSGHPRAIMKLQQVLGLKADGILGVRTMEAIRRADHRNLIERCMTARRVFLRNLPHYPDFAGGWETRCNRIERAALCRLETVPVEHPDYDMAWTPSIAAVEAEPTSMLKSDTGNTAIAVQGSGLAGLGAEMGQALKAAAVTGKVTLDTVLIYLLASPVFWASLIAFCGGVAIWLERRRKMRREHAIT